MYSPLVYHWCRRAGMVGEDIHDVVQEVFQALSMNLDQFDKSRGPGAFRKWVRGITRFKVCDYFKGKARQPYGAGGTDAYKMILEVPVNPEDDSEAENESERNTLYLRALDLIRGDFEERTWQAFWRLGVENKATDEVAAELGMTAMAVRQAKSRVLRRIKDEVGDLIG
jgi:RNA polymerase sigma-70 factor (ECF subfamily)